jgi:hypothetical protein
MIGKESEIPIRVEDVKLDRPDSPGYEYYDQGSLTISIRNLTGEKLFLDEVLCRFEGDVEADRTFRLSPVRQEVDPGGTSAALTIPFTIRPSFRRSSNRYEVGVQFRRSDHLESVEGPYWPYIPKCIVVSKPPPSGKSVFVSHCSPEDNALAEDARDYLERASFEGYLALEDPQPGKEDYWDEKLFPAIDCSSGVVVIWTEATEGRPAGILKEVERARKRGKKVYPIVKSDKEDLSTLPIFRARFSPEIVEHRRFKGTDIFEALSKVVDQLRVDKGIS